MKMRAIGLAAALMLAGTLNAGAQKLPDAGDRGPGGNGGGPSGSSERMPSMDAPRGGGDRGMRDSMSGPSRADKPARIERRESSQGGGERLRNNNRGEGPPDSKPSRAADETQKSGRQMKERAASDEKSGRDKPDRKSQQSKPDNKPDAKAAAESKSPAAESKKSAERGKAKSDDSAASGASTGEGGSDKPGKLTEDRKKTDEARKVRLSGERSDRVQTVFRSHRDIKRETNVNVRIAVGTRVPRSWAFAPVPMAVVEVVPEYRGYVYAYVDDEYVICDPDTYEIVAVLPESGSGGSYAAAGDEGTCSEDIVLSEADRDEIIRSVEIANEVDISGVSIGFSVPSDVEILPFPPAVIEHRSELGSCRYFVVDNQIAIVDPDEDRVVMMIENE